MERGREGRRGGAGGGAVSAPRRPRTIGFKDASVGEDGDELMDDVHNPRLRERSKKETSNAHVVQGLSPSGLASVSRSKRKRHGSQEVHDQARNTTVDDIDETAEDTEMDISDDDDDPPPPPIPRRAVKYRPQGKFLEDGLSADLPTVPRKARTAILKRPQETVAVVEGFSHQAPAIPRAPATSNMPSSSSVASITPGRRTKPFSSKSRASKLSKMSSQTMISEQEVEVAEALFDLARMVTNQPIATSMEESVGAIRSNKVDMEPNAELEVKLEPNASVDFTVTPSLLRAQCSDSSMPESMAALYVCSTPSSSNPPSAVSTCSPTISAVPSLAATTVPESATTSPSPRPIPSPSVLMVVPPAEAPKRKRPRFKARSDDSIIVSQPVLGINAVARGSSVLCSPFPKTQSEQVLDCVAQPAGESLVKMEIGAGPSPSPTVVPPPPVTPPSVQKALDLPTVSTPVSVQICNSAEKRSVLSEKAAKVEVSFTSLENYETPTPDRKLVHGPERVGSPKAVLMQAMEPILQSTSGSMSHTTLEDGKRYQDPSSTNEVRTKKLGTDWEVCLPTLAPVDDLLIDSDRRKEKHNEQEHGDRVCGKELVAQRERSTERVSEQENHLSEEDNRRQLSKARDLEEESERAEFSLQPSDKKFEKARTLDPNTLNVGLAVSAASSSTVSSFLVSALPGGVSSVATSVSGSAATVPLSVGLAGWPVGLPPVAYYSSGAVSAATPSASWPGGGPASGLVSVDENTSPAVQLQQPYVIQARQPQPWKRCASHVYIAHFIDAQQQMNRHPFIQAAYQNSATLFGSKSYNLNIPLTPSEALFGGGSGGLLTGGMSGANSDNVVTGGGNHLGLPGNDRNLGASFVSTDAQVKDRGYVEATSRKQGVQQLQQPLQISPNVCVQGRPGFGFPVAQIGTAGEVATAVVNGGGTLAGLESGGGSALLCLSSGPTAGSTTLGGHGTGASNGGVVSHASAQAQYLHAVMQQGSFPFPFQAAPQFGPGFSTCHQQAAQYFSSPFYATHLVQTNVLSQQPVQKSSNAPGGPVSSELQNPQQQVARNLQPSTSQQQPHSVSPSSSPSLSQQLHAQVSTSQLIQRLVERDGNNLSESNSTNESKFPLLQGNAISQDGSRSVTTSVNPPSSMLLGGSSSMHSLQPQEFNFGPVLGGKPSKQPQQSQLTSQHLAPLQQQQQHVSTGAAIQMSIKGTDQQSSHTFTALPVAALTRASTIGPGPLGLAPVAPVMAPQGHAMLQSVGDSCRGHGQHQQAQHLQSSHGQSHQLSLLPGQQQLRAVPAQRGVTVAVGIEEGRAITESTASYPNKSGREMTEERKALSKRGVGSGLPLSRVDLESSTASQVSPTCGGSTTARTPISAGPALNLLTPTSAILITRSSGHTTCGSLQQTGPSLPLIQNSKQVTPRNKLISSSCAGNLVTSAPAQLSSFSDRPPLGSSNKVSGPPLSSPGQGLAHGGQVPRQTVTQQRTQLKLSNRGSLGSLPTPMGTAPQAVLAAAIAKSQQGVQQQQSRLHNQLGAGTAPVPRLPSGNMGLSTSNSTTLRPSSPAAKSVSNGAAKNNLSTKGSLPVSQRPSSAVPAKRSTASSCPNVSSILGPTLLQATNTSSQQHPSLSKPLCQPQQNSSQQPSSQPPLTSTPTHQQYHHQQVHINSQQLHQMHNQQALSQQQQTHHVERQLFLQTTTFQSHQHAPGSLVTSHLQQPGVRQQSQQPSSQAKTQQVNSLPSPLQPKQHHSSPQHQQQQGSQGGVGFPVTIPSGSLSLGPPLLTLGTGSNGKINNSSWTPGSDGLAASQCSGPRANPANSGSSAATPPGSTLPRSHCGAPTFLHTHFGSGAVSGQQQSTSPRSSSGTQFLQPVAALGDSGIAVDENGVSGGVAKNADSGSQPKL